MGEGLGVRVREVAIGDFLNPHNFVETFRRFALAQLGVSLAWCVAANVSTLDGQKGDYISGFGITSVSF